MWFQIRGKFRFQQRSKVKFGCFGDLNTDFVPGGAEQSTCHGKSVWNQTLNSASRRGSNNTTHTRRSRTQHATHLNATQVYLSERPTQRSRVERIKNSKQIVSSCRLKHKPPVCPHSFTEATHTHAPKRNRMQKKKKKKKKNQSETKPLALSSSVSSAST